MAQHSAPARSRLAAVGIDERAVGCLGHGVDRQVAPPQVLLQRDARVGVDGEAAIAGPGLALGARQGVFLARLRVQEHREVAAHGQVAARFELGRRRADDHPVALGDGRPSSAVADRTTHEIDLHPCMLPEHSCCASSPCRASPAAAPPTCCRRRAASTR
jgi:hypothetical protein